jgi:hypothetical protein
MLQTEQRRQAARGKLPRLKVRATLTAVVAAVALGRTTAKQLRRAAPAAVVMVALETQLRVETAMRIPAAAAVVATRRVPVTAVRERS